MPIDSIIKIAGTGDQSALTSDVASIDIPEDGLILGILGTVLGTGAASGDEASAEISFLSSSQLAVNDARGCIMEIGWEMGTVTTSGQTMASETQFMSIPDGIPVAAGERIHLHTFGSTGVTPRARFMLYLTFQPGTGRRASRRR